MSDRSTDRSGFSNVGSPPELSTLPQNALPIIFDGFTGLNTKASQQGIGDQEMYVCDGFMPLGPNNLRTLYDLGTAIYTAPVGRTIKNFGFANIGSTPICIVCLDDGSLIQVNTSTLGTVTIGTAGTITTFNPGYSQWSSQYAIIVSGQTNGYFLWDGTSLFKSGTIGPTVTIIDGGTGYTSAPTITIPNVGAYASGTITWAVPIVNGETVTLNGVLWTFVTGAPVGNQIQIGGTNTFTVSLLANALIASTDPLLTVAGYVVSGASTAAVLTVTYHTVGTVGNAYTLAASIATRSGPTLAGGVNGGAGVTITGTVANGSLVSGTVTNPGAGFSIGDLPIATVTGGGSDDSARATPTVSTASGVVSVLVNNGGGGYSGLARVTATGGGASTQASFVAVGQNGVITQVVVQNPGIGYTSVPVLSITDSTGSIGSGATLTAVLEAGQISAVTLNSGGTGYTSPPTVTVVGDGIGAQVQATLTGTLVDPVITVINPGIGYTKAALQFQGGNRSAAVSVLLMPFGINGTTAETYQSRVWVGNGRRGQYSGVSSDPADFTAASGAGAFQSTDSFLKVAYQRFIQSNGFMYLFGDSSINYISGVTTSGNPSLTTFNNLNVDPQIGTAWPDTIQPFGRDIVFANPIGVYVSYGGAVTKVSDALDGIYTSLSQASWPAGFTPSAAIMTIFGIQTYVLLMPINDPVNGTATVKCLMWDGKKWWTSSQTGITVGFVATQIINSAITAYCSPDNSTIKAMFSSGSKALVKTLYSKLWDKPGIFTTKMTRYWFVVLQANQAAIGTAASGTITWSIAIVNGETATLNGVAYTFVTGAPVGNQIQITGTNTFVVSSLATALNASVNPSLDVATYVVSGASTNAVLTVTYDSTGTAGNAYTLAASTAVVSGAHLSGGTNPEDVTLSSITEYGVRSIKQFTIDSSGVKAIGPIPIADQGRLQGIKLSTTAQDIQLNSLQMINQIIGSNT